MDIGQFFTSLFDGLGIFGLLLTVFVLFYIDAIIFPTLPELFTVIIFMAQPDPVFAAEILITIAIAEFFGLSTLYIVVKKLRVPHKVQHALTRYSKFLIVKNEKIILVNRIAPVLPFMGAFAAVCGWSFRKCVWYTFIGGMVKYGIILALSSVFFAYMTSGMAQFVTIILVLAIIVISMVVAYLRRDKGVCDADP